jgi:hypothetical protein
MLKSKTHFEQVPLESVRKIVEEQFTPEVTTKQDRTATKKKKKLEKDFLAAQEQSSASSRAYPQVE